MPPSLPHPHPKDTALVYIMQDMDLNKELDRSFMDVRTRTFMVGTYTGIAKRIFQLDATASIINPEETFMPNIRTLATIYIK